MGADSGAQPSGYTTVVHELLRLAICGSFTVVTRVGGIAQEFEVVVVLRIDALMQPRPRVLCSARVLAQHEDCFRVVICKKCTHAMHLC